MAKYGNGLAGLATAARAVVGTYQFFQAMKPRTPPKPVDPMEGMATATELQRFAFDPDGFYLGRIHDDHGPSFEASLPASDDRHLLIVAGSASGLSQQRYVTHHRILLCLVGIGMFSA